VDLKKATPVTLTMAPGFIFMTRMNRLQLILTLKHLKFKAVSMAYAEKH